MRAQRMPRRREVKETRTPATAASHRCPASPWTGVGSDRESEMNINFSGPYYF